MIANNEGNPIQGSVVVSPCAGVQARGAHTVDGRFTTKSETPSSGVNTMCFIICPVHTLTPSLGRVRVCDIVSHSPNTVWYDYRVSSFVIITHLYYH